MGAKSLPSEGLQVRIELLTVAGRRGQGRRVPPGPSMAGTWAGL